MHVVPARRMICESQGRASGHATLSPCTRAVGHAVSTSRRPRRHQAPATWATQQHTRCWTASQDAGADRPCHVLGQCISKASRRPRSPELARASQRPRGDLKQQHTCDTHRLSTRPNNNRHVTCIYKGEPQATQPGAAAREPWATCGPRSSTAGAGLRANKFE